MDGGAIVDVVALLTTARPAATSSPASGRTIAERLRVDPADERGVLGEMAEGTRHAAASGIARSLGASASASFEQRRHDRPLELRVAVLVDHHAGGQSTPATVIAGATTTTVLEEALDPETLRSRSSPGRRGSTSVSSSRHVLQGRETRRLEDDRPFVPHATRRRSEPVQAARRTSVRLLEQTLGDLGPTAAPLEPDVLHPPAERVEHPSRIVDDEGSARDSR